MPVLKMTSFTPDQGTKRCLLNVSTLKQKRAANFAALLINFVFKIYLTSDAMVVGVIVVSTCQAE